MAEASDDYLYKNDFKQAEKRLEYLEKIEDPYTYEFISKLNLKKGSTCLELGAGRGSVAKHLCDIVGKNGLVRAVDIDTRFLNRFSLSQLLITDKNIEDIEFNTNEYDFIHARHILLHIKRFDKILEALYNALKPNGWILIEESDFLTWSAIKSIKNEDIPLFNDVIQKILDLYASRGMDTGCGTACYKQMSDYKNKVLTSNSRCRMVQGGSDEAKFHKITMGQLQPTLSEIGSVDDDILKKFLALHMNKNFYYRTRMTNSILMQKR